MTINLKEIKQRQDTFFKGNSTKSWDFRAQQLKKLKKLLVSHHEELLSALAQDLGKTEFESIASELLSVFEEINHFLKHGTKWSKAKKVPKTFLTIDGTGYTQSVPFGVSLIISPWNYPIQLTLLPLVGSIGAGNCAIIKPSELTPNVSKVLAKIINGNFEPSYLYVAEGGVDVNQELLSIPFDKVFFTGSPRVGQIVMNECSKHLADITLELGGKSPVIIDSQLSKNQLKASIKRLLWGKSLNSGQTCIAPDYIMLPENMLPLFKDVVSEILPLYKKEKEQYPIINQAHFDRLVSYLNDGEILHGGKYDANQKSIQLTTILVKDLQKNVMKDEIFGPIIPIVLYNSINDALEKVNSICSYPLAMYIFSENPEFIDFYLTNVQSGGTSVNDTISHILNHNLPFGGVKTSGIGGYHGKYSFDCFSRTTAIFKKSLFFELPFRYPPYEKNLNFLKKRLQKVSK